MSMKPSNATQNEPLDDWFNKENSVNITKLNLKDLLRITTKNQLFQLEGNLYKQVDGVAAMGSSRGPLMANPFICKIEKQLETENKMPAVCKPTMSMLRLAYSLGA